MTDVNNRDDMIDSRDVIARIDELENERTDLVTVIEDAQEFLDDITTDESNDGPDSDAKVVAAREEVKSANEALADWDHGSEGDELKALKALADEASGYAAEWRHGETLIRDSYFKTYAQALAEDIGAIESDTAWPSTCIDWEQAADELKQDYTSVDFGGVDYWIR